MKQVIIVRKDLKMRKGKMIAQGAHACRQACAKTPKETLKTWIKEGETKIAVGVDSFKELTDIYAKAASADLPRSLIRDAGKTEFKCPEFTAVAIGPCSEEEVDKITGELKLL